MQNMGGLKVVPGISLLVVLGMAFEVHAQLTPDWTHCINEVKAFSPDVTIAGCTAVINSGRERGNNLAIAYSNRGTAYRAKGESDSAIADHTRAIEIEPQFAGAYFNRGNAYSARGETERAIADHTRAIEINPKYADAYINRGSVYRQKGDLDRALADLTTAIQINPKDADAYIGRGSVYKFKSYEFKDDIDRAIADFTRAIEINPKDANAYSDRGDVHQQKGDLDRALADFTKALEINAKYAYAYFRRGRVYLDKGDAARASADLGQAIRLNPDLGNVLIFFDYESSSAGQGTQPLIMTAAAMFQGAGAKEIRIAAHTDTAETNSDALSMARATAIRRALISNGVPANSILLQGMGSTSPLVPTPKETKEPQNRRAHINIVP